MKKLLPLVLLVACAALMLPVAAFASSADVDEPEAKPTAEATTYEQGIHEMEMPDGGIVKVGFSSTEQTGENAARSDCSNGNHTNKSYIGQVDATRIHQPAANHPCSCIVVYSQNWQCSACNASGVDKRTILDWCPSVSVADGVGEIDPNFLFEE